MDNVFYAWWPRQDVFIIFKLYIVYVVLRICVHCCLYHYFQSSDFFSQTVNENLFPGNFDAAGVPRDDLRCGELAGQPAGADFTSLYTTLAKEENQGKENGVLQWHLV